MAHAEPAEALGVVVAYSPRAGQVDEVSLSMPVGATVADAVHASGLMQRHPMLALASLRIGVWGKLRQPADALRDHDRVELYRPLTVDPKEARRLRYRQHRERYAAK
jgi:uncharacterized protein